MGAGPGRADDAGMPDVRRALPTAPVAVWAGLLATTPWLAVTLPIWMPALVALFTIVTVFALTYGVMASWTERVRRLVGYLAVTTLALAIGAVLFLLALLTACWSPSHCDEQTADTFARAALLTPLVLPGLYATLDLLTYPRHPTPR
jgi:hypothetical protein